MWGHFQAYDAGQMSDTPASDTDVHVLRHQLEEMRARLDYLERKFADLELLIQSK